MNRHEHQYSIVTDGLDSLKIVRNSTGEIIQSGIDGRESPEDTKSFFRAWKQARHIRDHLEAPHSRMKGDGRANK